MGSDRTDRPVCSLSGVPASPRRSDRIAARSNLFIALLLVLPAVLQASPEAPVAVEREDDFQAWNDAFYWLSGRLMSSFAESGEKRDLELAFEVSERRRARALRRSLIEIGITPRASNMAPLANGRDQLLRRYALEAQALEGSTEEEPGSPSDDTSSDDLGLAPAAGPRRAAATEEEVRLALDPGTALLAFQMPGWSRTGGGSGGGSWVTATTRRGTRAYALPQDRELERRVASFLRLIRQRAPEERSAAVALHEELLARALSELPESVERLVLVPDGPLCRLPFAALRSSLDSPFLAESFELSLAPSATAVARSLERPSIPERTGSALALDGPSYSPSIRAQVAELGWSEDLLERRPETREESRAVVRRLGVDSTLLVGPDASERNLQTIDLSAFQLIHLAVPAVADGRHPSRSALVLSSDPGGADGFVQPAQIASLDLRGRVVVLAHSESAGGIGLRGPGALRLAPLFLYAGSPSVVTTLWRLSDRESATILHRFYRHLARGATVAQAVREAQIDRIRSEAPTADWAGLVVVASDDVIVEGHEDRKARKSKLVLLAAAAGLLLLGTLWVLYLWASR